jgi:hypothetical protein
MFNSLARRTISMRGKSERGFAHGSRWQNPLHSATKACLYSARKQKAWLFGSCARTIPFPQYIHYVGGCGGRRLISPRVGSRREITYCPTFLLMDGALCFHVISTSLLRCREQRDHSRAQLPFLRLDSRTFSRVKLLAEGDYSSRPA